ncbi:MAG: hypothetical protein K2L28_01425 [Muribaculaceae bacterium]|nr:hypothetical protein [Muribaculaceae bacterium]
MKNLFNKLKSGLDALTGSPERTLELAKNALKKVEGVWFREDNGILTEKIDATDTFNYVVVRQLIPDKKSLTLEVVIDTIPDDDYAERAAGFDFGTPLLKSGAKNGQPCVTAVFEDAALKTPEALADAIKSALETLDAAIDDFAAKMGLLLVKPTPTAMRAALKKRGDVDVSNVIPQKKTAQPTGVFVTVKVDEFKYYKLRLAGFEYCIYPTFYLTNINADADNVIRIFSDNNLKALRLDDGSVKVLGEFNPTEFRTIKRLESCLSAYIDTLTKSLRQINEICPLGDPQLRAKAFDCWGIEEVFIARKDFKNYKHEGVVTLNTPAGAGGFKFAKNTTIGVRPSKVTVCTVVDTSVKKDSAKEKVLAEFNKKSADIQAEITAAGSLKVQGIDEASRYDDANSAVQYGVMNVVELFDKVSDSVPVLLKAMGVEARSFILDDVRQTLKKLSGFNKIDDDGDVNFKFNLTEQFSHGRFVWVYVKSDRLEFDAGVSSFKASMPVEEALEKVKAAFKNNNDGISYRISGETIRAKKILYRKDLADDNLAGQIKETAQRIIKELNSRMEKVAEICGMSTRLFILDDVRQTLKTISGFNKIDDDGDVFFKYNLTEQFSYVRFVWVYVKSDRLEFDARVSGFKASMPVEEALEKVKAAFKNNNDGISYRISGETIRAKKILYRKDLADDNLAGQIKETAQRIIKELNGRMEKVAEICGMPPFVIGTDVFKKACLKADLTEVQGFMSAGDMFEWQFGAVFLYGRNSIRVMIKRTPTGMKDDLVSDIKKLDNRIELVECFSDTTNLNIRQLSYNTFESLVADIRNLRSLGNKADDVIIEHNRKVKEYNDKQEAIASAEADLNARYWMEIDSGTEVRWIQKTFNEWFPYLRLGIFMVKTGQSADRNGDSISSYDLDTTMQQIRSFKSGGRLTIYGRSTPADVEREFRSRFGLVVKVCYTDPNKHRYYISKTASLYKKSLVEIERQFKKEGGYYYNDWY